MKRKTKRKEGYEWYCYGRCGEFVEINQDFEQDVCGQCHQGTIALRPVEFEQEKTEKERGERRQEASAEAMRDPARAHEMFEEMRKAIA